MDIQNIPWRTIDAKLNSLGPGHHQAWLARQLNVGTNVIANWRARGGAPLSRASDLARVLGCSTDELLLPKARARESRSGDAPTYRATRPDAEAELVEAFRSMSASSRQELQRFAKYLLAKESGSA